MRHPGRLRLSLRQVLAVPVLAAIAMACHAQMLRSGMVAQYGLIQSILIEAILLPLALAVVAQVLLPRNLGRDRLVAGLLGVSTAAGMLAIVLLKAVTLWDIGASVAGGRGLPIDLVAFLIVLAGGLIALAQGAEFLRGRLSPDRCPNCGLAARRPDRTSPDDVRADDSPRPPRCDACGACIRRTSGGAPGAEDEPRSEGGRSLAAAIRPSGGRTVPPRPIGVSRGS